MIGATLATLKRALIDQLDSLAGLADVNVSYEPPHQAKDLAGPGGNLDAVWLGDATLDFVVPVMTGGALWFDVTYLITVVIQSLKNRSDGTQEAADIRAGEMLDEIVTALSTDATLDLDLPVVEMVPESAAHMTGFLAGSAGHGSRYELTVRALARLQTV